MQKGDSLNLRSPKCHLGDDKAQEHSAEMEVKLPAKEKVKAQRGPEPTTQRLEDTIERKRQARSRHSRRIKCGQEVGR